MSPGGPIRPSSAVWSFTHLIGTGTGSSSTGESASGCGTATAPKALSVPAGCVQKNNITAGWLPEAPDNFAKIHANLGKPGCFYGRYSQITSSSYDGSQLTQVSADDLGGTIFIASVMPSVPFTEVNSAVALQVAAVMKKFTNSSVEVYLRFGHEMNWYVQDSTCHGTASEFVAA